MVRVRASWSGLVELISSIFYSFHLLPLQTINLTQFLWPLLATGFSFLLYFFLFFLFFFAAFYPAAKRLGIYANAREIIELEIKEINKHKINVCTQQNSQPGRVSCPAARVFIPELPLRRH